MEDIYDDDGTKGGLVNKPNIFLPTAIPLPPQPFEGDDELFIRKALTTNLRLGVELLYKRYYQPLCTHAVKFVGSRETAEDIVSEIFFQFYTNKTFLEIETSYRSYLFRTVRNRSYNYLRWDLSRKADLAEAAKNQRSMSNNPIKSVNLKNCIMM